MRPPAENFVMNPLTKTIAYIHRYTAFDEVVVSFAKNKTMTIPLSRFPSYVLAPTIGTHACPIRGDTPPQTIIDYDINSNTVRLTNGVTVNMHEFIDEWMYEQPIGTQTQDWTSKTFSS